MLTQEIKKFHEILFAIDSFNEIFSKMIFGAVLSGGSHFSVYLMTVFQSESSVVDETFTIICFMIFWAQLLAAAEVGRSVSILGLIQISFMLAYATFKSSFLQMNDDFRLEA